MSDNLSQRKIQQIQLLFKKKGRERENKFLIEGPHLIQEAIKQNLYKIDYFVHTKGYKIDQSISSKAPCFHIDSGPFKNLSDVKTPQGILAIVSKREFDLNQVLKSKNRSFIICVEIQDPGNLGTIIRVADAVGISGVIVTSGTVDPYNLKSIRASQGSIFHIPIFQAQETIRELRRIKNAGIKLVGTDVKAPKKYYNIDLKGENAILIGNEGAGLPGPVLSLCDEKVSIPIPGKAESLNAGMAAGIVLYEGVRQKGQT